MNDRIPDDIMKTARSVAMRRLFSDRADRRDDEMTRNIAQALMAERESATKAERERCALIASEGSFPFDISVWLESTKKEMTAITAEAIAAAIRKGDGE